MWNKRSHRVVMGQVQFTLLWTACACLGVVASAQSAVDLPAGQGVDVVRTRCVTCHEADLIRQQRLTRPGWQRELDKMIRWGAVVASEAERNLLLEYFARNFGVQAPVPALAAVGSPGSEIFARRCLGCHDADIVEQQRLGRTGWTREIDKMIRWGAVVDETEKDPLITYLAGKFGTR